ncbi:nucleoside-diphosphate sugar epimerase/dehydratase [soil metagenome]
MKRMRRQTRFFLDIAAWTLATPLAFLIRHDGAVPAESLSAMLLITAALAGFKLLAHLYFGLHRQTWHKIAFRDLRALLQAVAAVTAGSAGLVFFVGPALGVPRSVPLLDGLIALLLLVSLRAAARYWHESSVSRELKTTDRSRVLIIGAGEAGTLIAREMLRHPKTGLKPVGFLDDDPRKVGQRIAAIPIVGTIADLQETVKRFQVDEVLIAMPSAEGKLIRNIVAQAAAAKVPSRTIPGIYEVLSGQVSVNRIRDVRIEDLLHRQPIKLDTAAISSYIEGKTVMITGAGGSIGSELVRQICRFNPSALILFGHGENSIYQLERELDRNWPEVPYHSVIGAIQNKIRLDYVFRRYQPEVIFHAAAHKHVPLMEGNPEEAVFNNIIGSMNLIKLALQYGISHFVNISTDKAVNPTSVMGASKRVVEYLVQSASNKARSNQVFVSVRFGNVLGSRGSVIPVFKKQIIAGGPVTVTHPDMVRFFMTIPEATQLVLQAAGQGRNGEIYILEMGEPVKILNLAHDLIRLSGLEPEVDIPIKFTGMRPGEKLFEELMTAEEKDQATAHEQILVSKPLEFDETILDEVITELTKAALKSDGEAVRSILTDFIDGCNFYYPPQAPGAELEKQTSKAS